MTAILEHARILEKLNKNPINKKGYTKNFASIKKFFKPYTTGFRGAKELRDNLMRVENSKEAEKIIKNF